MTKKNNDYGFAIHQVQYVGIPFEITVTYIYALPTDYI